MNDERILNQYLELNKDKLNQKKYNSIKSSILKTKLLKEMFYSDFLYYKNNTVSITGLEYAKITLGPVPDQYSKILSYLEEEGYIKIDTEFYQGDYVKEKISGLKKINYNVFDEDELKMIEEVKKYFKNYNSSEIAEYSHQEKAFKETKNNESISYDYAFDIELK